ncbi:MULTISPECIES: preprotein translocase subunit SecA [Methylobacterium]|uniref:Protein translocase subunit SecA n=1 Tax=Methylobacterium thuringiense TaxID=1003091 RepID=A0ABQ4TPC2_9HYPH|nr:MULTISPECIES: preprotein translocase subunit SecA [Methylobacterium]TXN24687.1 prepilin peptidase [Methylobacterium sp. WL9]GJE56846.1 Protein translocase subunit SecA [Methylobacterium thuringiense]
MSEPLIALAPSQIAPAEAAWRLPQARAYTERKPLKPDRLDQAVAQVVGLVRAGLAGVSARRYGRIAHDALAQAQAIDALSDATLRERVRGLAGRLRGCTTFRDADITDAFALIREVSGRVSGQRHYGVQMMGAAALLDGRIAQMATGEGKTLTATLAAGTAALAGLPVHVVTVNDYLAERDAELMRPLYAALGLTVGVIKEKQELAERAQAYSCNITYCTNKDLAFDYLRDRIALGQRASDVRLKLESLYTAVNRLGQLRLRGLYFAIVDEADSVLIDEARTPLIISAQAGSQFADDVLSRAMEIAKTLASPRDYAIEASEHRVVFTEAGRARIADLVSGDGAAWRGRVVREGLVRQALSALHLFHRDEHYILRDGKIVIVDANTGRVMPDRTWSDGLHQMVEHKEGCALSSARTTLARMTYQRFFRRYARLSGMTGTTRGVAAEFWTVYRLPVVRIPTHRPLKRAHLPDEMLTDEAEKWKRVTQRIAELHARGCPVLVGTRSVGASARASAYLTGAGLPHTVLSAAQDNAEASIVSEAGQLGRITVATNMAGRGTDIKLGPGVAERGGLHVIMVERQDARRIDDQLAGRSGRQGEPGCFQAILSLDDPLLAGGLIKSGAARRIMALLGHERGQAFGCRLLRFAQFRTERLHARMRADLLRSDQMQDRILAFAGHSE